VFRAEFLRPCFLSRLFLSAFASCCCRTTIIITATTITTHTLYNTLFLSLAYHYACKRLLALHTTVRLSFLKRQVMEVKSDATAPSAARASSSSPPALKEIGHPQLHLLQCFALADLLGCSPSARQKMAVAAAASAAEQPTTSSATSFTPPTPKEMSADSVEGVMVAAVVDHVTAAACGAASLASAHTFADSRGTSGTPSGSVPSTLAAPPWVAAKVTSRQQQQLLPAVLSTPDGVARVDALHPTFVLQLLIALLRAACCPPDDRGVGVDQRRKSQEAFLQLLQLYAPFVWDHHRAVLTAMNEALRLLCSDGSATTSSDTGENRDHELVHCLRRNFLSPSPTSQWLTAFLSFRSSVVDLLAAQSRNVARRVDLRCGCTEGPAEVEAEAVWILQSLGVMLSLLGFSPNHVAAACTSAAAAQNDASATTVDHQPAEEKSTTEATHSHPAPREVVSTDALAQSHSGLARLRSHRCGCSSAEAPSFTAVVAHTCRSLLSPPQTQSSGGTDTSAVRAHAVAALLGTLRSFKATDSGHAVGVCNDNKDGEDGTCHGLSAAVWDASTDQLLTEGNRLLSQHEEELERQQHRLLAAAERAVQRVLRLPTMPWYAPSMLVALCEVTAYQLTMQLRQHQQRYLEVVSSEQRDKPQHTNTESENGALGERPLSSPAGDATSAPPPPAMMTTMPTASSPSPLGECLWSDSEVTEEEEEEDHGGVLNTPNGPSGSATEHNAVPLAGASPPLLYGASLTAKGSLQEELHVSLEVPPPQPQLCLYTPRASSLSQPAFPRGPSDEREDAGADTTVDDTLACLSDPVRLFSPTRLMEHLWELPPRVPRRWTPSLATVMACCSLCIPPTTTAASLLSVLAGWQLQQQPTQRVTGDDDTAIHPSAFTFSSSSAQSSTHASPRQSLLDFGFARRRSPATATEVTAEGPRSGNGGGSPEPTKTTTTAASAVAIVPSDVDVVGALAQWHLRGLIAQLRISPDGMMCDTRDCNAAAAAAAGQASVGSSSPPMPPSGLASATGVLSSVTAIGGASWFTAYSRTNTSAPFTRTRGMREGSSAASQDFQHRRGHTVAVWHHVNTVSVVASCFALQHLLRTHQRFFAHARLGGSALRELRAGVAGARSSAGGAVGWVAGMLQCPSSLWTSAGRVGGGGHPQPSSAPSQSRGHSLWGDVGVAGQGGDRSATAVMDAVLVDAQDDTVAATITAAPTNSSTATAKEVADLSLATAAGMCAMTEAVLVAVSFLGSRVVALALTHLQSSVDTSGIDTAPEAVGGSRNEEQDSFRSTSQMGWCAALQALAGLTLDAHRVHRSRHHCQLAGGNAIVTGTESQILELKARPSAATPPSDVWRRATSVGSARGGSVDPPPTLSHIEPASPAGHALPPASLSTEAQFGIATFFLSLVRALLQLHDSNQNTLHHGEAASPTPAPQSAAVRVVAQCTFVLASIVDDLLHDYTHRPPAALCDVLAMLSTMQPPCTSISSGEGRSAEAKKQVAGNVWEALRRTPYWDGVRLGALESASRAWSTTPASPPHATDARRRSSALSDGVVSPAGCVVPPRDTLLGYIPCSRDPTTLSWLPTTVREEPMKEAESPYSGTLLELMADEEAMLLATRSSRVQEAGSDEAAKSSHDGGRRERLDEEDSARQLAIAAASSRRYVWWMWQLQQAWDDAVVESIVYA
jgi:hypothetical protein